MLGRRAGIAPACPSHPGARLRGLVPGVGGQRAGQAGIHDTACPYSVRGQHLEGSASHVARLRLFRPDPDPREAARRLRGRWLWRGPCSVRRAPAARNRDGRPAGAVAVLHPCARAGLLRLPGRWDDFQLGDRVPGSVGADTAQRSAAWRPRSYAEYIASISAWYLAVIGLRLSFIVGVSSSPPGFHSPGTTVNLFSCSTRAKCEFASSIACWTASTTFGSLASCSSLSPSIPCCFAHWGA